VTDLTTEEIQKRLVALTRNLILIPSIPSQENDIGRCFDFIKNHLESLEHIEIREFEKDGMPSLVAAPPKCKKPDILLCGHLDVITHPDLSYYKSHITDGRIIGPGAGDMKGALAILLEVFRNFHTKYPEASLGIAITSDEESGGEAGIGYLFNEKKLRCGLAMIPDGGSINNITIEEKGILHLKVTCEGKSSHAARPWLGENPIESLMEKLKILKAKFDSYKHDENRWYSTCSITIVGTENETTNRIASNAFAVLDIRFTPPHTLKSMMKDIEEILGTETQIKTIIGADPTHLSPDEKYCQITEELTKEKVNLIQDDGGSDGRFIAAHGIPVIMSRPLVGNLHSCDEWIDIDSMVTFYKIYEKYLWEKLVKK